MKKCQFCAEEIQDEAIKCKHCGSDLQVSTPDQSEKPRIGIIKSFLWAGAGSFLFLLISLRFMQDASGLSFEQKANVGQTNLWRIVLLFGLFSLAISLLSIKFKKIRTIQIFLWIFWVLGSAIVVMASLKTNLPAIVSNRNPGELKQRIEEIVKLSNEGDYGKIYDSYLTNEAKQKISRDMYLKLNDKPSNFVFDENSVVVKDDKGYAIQTIRDCSITECKNGENNLKRYAGFIYENNNWFYDYFNSQYCIRDVGYNIPDEFKRAISLISQRMEQSGNKGNALYGKEVRAVSNCLNIQYAKSDQEMAGAEGMFLFAPTQSLDEYDILVSPKYSAKDDLLTAILLAHEIKHVLNHIDGSVFINTNGASPEMGKSYEAFAQCYADEASAFSTQNTFIGTLNKEEFNSLVSRVQANNSPGAYQALLTYTVIPKFQGASYLEKALNFVKSNPAYQEECKNR